MTHVSSFERVKRGISAHHGVKKVVGGELMILLVIKFVVVSY